MGLFEEPAEGYLFKANHDTFIYALQLQNLCCFFMKPVSFHLLIITNLIYL